ncbi:MAG TPA: helix-turn-helix transcriptional regulator [Hyalangium sp.]|jgi:transcriptional regulator with XRE-family HTH domain|nr:helix-turn-helix transcriptional regulator [Hyalangium sp.]
MDDFMKILGANMRKARHRQGLTQEEVAASIDIPAEVYERMEKGSMVPRLGLFVTLCSRLGTTPNQLLGFGPSPPAEGEG